MELYRKFQSVFLLVLLLILVVNMTDACPSVCICIGTRVDCTRKHLQVIPTNLPRDVVYLDLQNNGIEEIAHQFWNMTKVEQIHLR